MERRLNYQSSGWLQSVSVMVTSQRKVMWYGVSLIHTPNANCLSIFYLKHIFCVVYMNLMCLSMLEGLFFLYSTSYPISTSSDARLPIYVGMVLTCP